MLRTRILRTVAELEALTPRWRRLLEIAVHAEPVTTPLWLTAWWREFGPADRRALRAVAVEAGGELVGLVPLALRLAVHRRAVPVRRVELLGTGEAEADEICSDYVGAIVATGHEDAVAAATAAALRDRGFGAWDELRLTAMSERDPFVPKLLSALNAAGVRGRLEPSGDCAFIPLPPSWDEYLQALGSSRRYVVTRSLRELDRWAGEGGWELRRARTLAELVEGMAALRELHAARWNAEGKAGVFASARFARFHDAVTPRLLQGEDGASLELLWLLVRGEPVAAAYNVVYRGKLRFYQSGRRVDVPKGVRPGIAMHALAIRASIEAGRREYDFLAGASRYKRDLALASRRLVTLRAVGPGLRARTVDAACRLADRAIARLHR